MHGMDEDKENSREPLNEIQTHILLIEVTKLRQRPNCLHIFKSVGKKVGGGCKNSKQLLPGHFLALTLAVLELVGRNEGWLSWRLQNGTGESVRVCLWFPFPRPPLPALVGPGDLL